jgi:ribonuclease HII
VRTPTLERESALWAEGCRHVAGVDEVGRGPLAGPVVAAAVIFYPDRGPLEGLRDSKQMTPRQRDRMADAIRSHVFRWAIGAASVREIDRNNILRATALAMRRALHRPSTRPSCKAIRFPSR